MNEEFESTKNRPDWLIPYLMALYQKLFRRWDHCLTAAANKILPDPIPYIPFRASYCFMKNTSNRTLKCLDYANHYSSYPNPLNKFIYWLLWGFNYRLMYLFSTDHSDCR